MRNRHMNMRMLMMLSLLALACISMPGLARATPTLWVLAPTFRPPTSPAATMPNAATPPLAVAASPALGAPSREVSLLKCQNSPSSGVVLSGTPVVLVWGWATDNQAKRDEFISLATFAVEIDGVAQDVGAATESLESATTVMWRLPIGQLPPGSHQVKLTRILSRNFTETSGTTPAGRQTQAACTLVIQQ